MPITIEQRQMGALMYLTHVLFPISRVRFGRRTFYGNLMIYLGYLVLLTLYVNTVEKVITTELIDDVHWCPIYLNETEKNNQTLVNYYKQVGSNVYI